MPRSQPHRLIICVHKCFLRHREPRRFPACLRHVHGFPVRGLLCRLRLLQLIVTGLARLARCDVRAISQDSHVPAIDLASRRRRALPLAIFRTAVRGGNTAIEPDIRAHQPGTSNPAGHIACGSQSHQTSRELRLAKYRGFRHTLCRLAIGHVVARPAMDGSARYSSVRQLFHAPSQTRHA